MQRYFHDGRESGFLDGLNRHRVALARQAAGRTDDPSAGVPSAGVPSAGVPSAGVIDSQSVKTTESGGVRGDDAGKRIKRRKRHIVTDTLGFLVGIVVHRADIPDRDGAPAVRVSINATCPLPRHIFADGGHAGPRLKGALAKIGRWRLQIVKRSDPAPGFELLPRRWVVERSFAGLGRCRRMAKDWQKTIASAQAWRRIAHIRLLTCLLARK